jgi:hypothetical protein
MYRSFDKWFGKICLLSSISLSSIFFTKAQGQQIKSPVVEITNTDSLLREELATIPYAKFIKAYPEFKEDGFTLIDVSSGKEVHYQVEYKGESKPQNILVQISCKPRSVIKLVAKRGVPTGVQAKTYARFVPERFDDFAWENNRIAFRMYGPALASRPDNAYGIDVWVKRTPELVINKWYKEGNYHKDNGEGMDYYGVGKTLGAGDIGFFVNDSIIFTNNYTSWRVLDNGPFRSTFQLRYSEKSIGGKLVGVTKTISLDVGSQLNKIEVCFSGGDTSALQYVIGIARRGRNGAILLNEQEGIMGYWEPESPGNGITGVGCILPPGSNEMKLTKGQLLYLSTLQPGQKLIYYTGAAWNKAALINSATQWFDYLCQFALKSKHPVDVNIN